LSGDVVSCFGVSVGLFGQVRRRRRRRFLTLELKRPSLTCVLPPPLEQHKRNPPKQKPTNRKQQQPIGDELLPGQETSLEYAFRVDPVLAGREFGLSVSLAYASASAPGLVAAVFNQTVDVTEPPRLVDTEALFMFAVLAVLGLGAAYLGYGAVADRLGLPTAAALLGKAGAVGGGGGAAGAAGGGAARKAAPKKPADDDEWVKGTSYDLAKRKRATVAARVKATAE